MLYGEIRRLTEEDQGAPDPYNEREAYFNLAMKGYSEGYKEANIPFSQHLRSPF